MTKDRVGTDEGDICNRAGCTGIMIFEPTENCSCHINPPCSACVNNPLVCDECMATPEDEE